LIVKND